MVEEGDPVPFRRQPRVADVARGLVEDLAHRELDARLPADVADDEEALPVRRPSRRPGCPPPRRAGAPPVSAARASVPRHTPGWFDRQSTRDRHLARRRDPQQVRARQLQRERVRAARVLQEQLQGAVVPGGAVDDRLAVRGEARGADRAAAERDLLVGRGPGLRDGASRGTSRRGARRRAPRPSPPRGPGDACAARVRARRPRSPRLPRWPRRGARGRSRGRARGRASRRSARPGPSARHRSTIQRSGAGTPALSCADRLRLLADDRGQRLGARAALEGPLPGRHLVEDRAEGELVGAEVERPSRSPARATCSRRCRAPCPARVCCAVGGRCDSSCGSRLQRASRGRSRGS